MGDDKGLPSVTSLHRRDPRLKVLLLLLVVVTIFSARSFIPLFFVALVSGIMCLWQPAICLHLKRPLYRLRWLLLFTLCLHLFLTPGRTLFGLKFLFYDGLIRGVMVDFQIFLALFFTLVLTLYTKQEAIAWAGSRLLQPLRFLGLPTPGAGGLVLLVLHFLPQIYRQGVPLFDKNSKPIKVGISRRLQNLSALVGGAVFSLVEQADDLSRDIHAGNSPFNVLKADFVWRLQDTFYLTLGLLFAILCWSI